MLSRLRKMRLLGVSSNLVSKIKTNGKNNVWLFFFLCLLHIRIDDWLILSFTHYGSHYSPRYAKLSAQKETAARIIRPRIQLALCSRCHAFKFGGKNASSSSRYLLAIKDTMRLQTRMIYHDSKATLRVTFWYCNVVRINPFIHARGCSHGCAILFIFGITTSQS